MWSRPRGTGPQVGERKRKKRNQTVEKREEEEKKPAGVGEGETWEEEYSSYSRLLGLSRPGNGVWGGGVVRVVAVVGGRGGGDAGL